jgi:dihydroxyacetone kinase-like protein
MKNILMFEDVCGLIAALSNDIIVKSTELGELDAIIGDGDMGVTVTIAFRAVGKYIKKAKDGSIFLLLDKCAEIIGEEAPSTFGTLTAAMFAGAAKAIGESDQLGTPEFALMIRAAAENVMERGKAKPGDKTMLDALIPAAEEAERISSEGGSLPDCIDASAKAAEKGAENTVGMRAKLGRAGYLGDNTIGLKDPGAAAVSMMLTSIRNYIFNGN